MGATIDLRSIELHHLEREAMSTHAHHPTGAHRWSDLPAPGHRQSYFLLGQNAQGLWVIRESTGRKAGVFGSRNAALRFARLESPDGQFAVVQLSDTMELADAAQHL